MFNPYLYGEQHNIEIIRFPMQQAKCFATIVEGQDYVAYDDNAWETEIQERYMLAHEIAHLQSGSLYSQLMPYETVGRIENRAEKKAIQLLIKKEELDEAVANGMTEVWDLADYFGVPEDIIKEAVSLYTHGNLNTYCEFL